MSMVSRAIAPFRRHWRHQGQQPEVDAVAPPFTALSHLPPGRSALVRVLRGGREFCSRVANLGFTEGASIQVQQNYGRGPILVEVRGALVALGRAEAEKILVQAEES